MTVAGEAPALPSERRFMSDQLMMEFAHALVERHIVTRGQIDELNSRRALTGESLDRLLIKESIVPEADVLRVLSELSGIPFRHLAELTITPDAVARVKPRAALRYRIVPIAIEGGVISLAVSQVPSVTMVDSLRMLLNTALEWILCSEREIEKSLKHFYGLGAETIDTLVEAAPQEQGIVTGQDVSMESEDEGVVKFVNQIILEAIRMNSTDIHIEPFEDRMRLRYRIDGLLQNIPVPKGVERLQRSIVSCVKILAEMNIAERRKPHDGRIKVRSGGDEFDLRVSILPTAYGETVALRILNRKTTFIDLENLGITASQIPHITYLSALPHGVILLTGPTGSGKTTTLYATLSRINTADVKIITVEDPIEYQIAGINQIQVHAQIGLTFATILRSILRHDPDIILIGEIRDTETADIAVRASLTGHLVFSTLHTNDAPSAVTRLADMDIEPFLISSCLEGAIAQRLVRRLCPACREPMTPDEVILEEIASAFPDRAKGASYFKGRGCPECNFTGYKGRIAVIETMLVTDPLRSLIVHQRPANEIKHKAIELGMIPLRNDGWGKVLDGVTTIEEIVRVARKVETTFKDAGGDEKNLG